MLSMLSHKGICLDKCLCSKKKGVISIEAYENSKDIKVEKLCLNCHKEVWRELEAIKKISKKLDQVIESSYDGIYITDGEAKTIKVNKSYERITGIKREEMLNKTMYEIIKNNYISNSCTLMVIENKKTTTIRQKLKTGKTVLATGTPIFDEAGNIELVVTNVRDLTEFFHLMENGDENKSSVDIHPNEKTVLYDIIDILHKNSIDNHETTASLDEEVMDLKIATSLLESRLIEKAFNKYKNVREAANALGISPATFVRKRRIKE